MTWTTPTDVTTSSTASSSKYNDEVVANLLHIYDLVIDPARIDLIRSTNQTITTSGAIEFSSTTGTTKGITWAASPNPERITPTAAGRYLIVCHIGFADKTDTTGRVLAIRKNGSTTLRTVSQAALSGLDTIMEVTGIISLNGSTDYVDVLASETASGTVTVNSVRFSAVWVAPV